jgi:hypothetical protein
LCHFGYDHGQPLPDPKCTPGALSPAVTQATLATTICRSGGYTSTIRPPVGITNKEKAANAKSDGYTGSLHDAEYDHLISLPLGGDPNDPRNLWVQPPSPGHKAGAGPNNPKDAVETRLHTAICKNQVTLLAAQRAIATDWEGSAGASTSGNPGAPHSAGAGGVGAAGRRAWSASFPGMGTESHLCLDPAAADFAVDMSNVMKAEDLCSGRPVDLARFVALIDGLIAHSRDETVQVYAVADGSLLRDRRLSENERATLKRWYRRGLIEVMDVADDRLLELADTTGQAVVSRDGYKDYCRQYPWIAGNKDRFFFPCPGPDGVGVVVEPRIMPVPTEWEMSHKEEERLLLGAGLYDRTGGTGPRRALLTRRWSCPEAHCPLFGTDRQAYQPVPNYRRGEVRCPTHQLPLRDVGPYPRRVQVKVRVQGVVRTRFLAAPRQEIAVGRVPGGTGIALAGWLNASGRSRVSRSHVTLRWDGWKLRVCDTSRNGTTIRRVRPVPEEFRLPPGEYRRLRPGDEIVLADGIELVVSGREYIFEEPTKTEVAPPDLAERLQEQAQQETVFSLDSSGFDGAGPTQPEEPEGAGRG